MIRIKKRDIGQLVEYRYFNKSKDVYIVFQCKKKNVIDDVCLLPSMFRHIWMDNTIDITKITKRRKINDTIQLLEDISKKQ